MVKGKFADIVFKLSPAEPDEKGEIQPGLQFNNKITGGVIPKNSFGYSKRIFTEANVIMDY